VKRPKAAVAGGATLAATWAAFDKEGASSGRAWTRWWTCSMA